MNDVIFKIVFGSQQNEALLRALLNALLGLTGKDRIKKLLVLNPDIEKSHLADKGIVLDVKARDELGRRFNIEVQLTDQPHFIKRTLYYLARLFSEQIAKGEEYEDIERTIAIAIVDFRLFPDTDDLHSTFRFHDVEHDRQLSDVLEIHYIEMIKFEGRMPDELRTPFERWLHVLKFGELYEELEQLPSRLKKEEGIEAAVDRMREARASDEVRELLLAREKFERDARWRLRNATEKGLAEGLEKGLAEGLEKGLAKGQVEGDLRARRDIARTMVANGANAEFVLKCTGVRIEDLDIQQGKDD